jgi:hypothetical protein
VAAQPTLERDVLERAVVLAQLALGHEPRQPGAAQRRQRREAREVAQAVERVHLPVGEEADADRREAQVVLQPELVDQAEHALVGGHDHVVEAVDPVTAEVEGAGQAAEARAALEQGHLRAGLLQAQREDRAEDAAADDADAGSGGRHATCSRRRGALAIDSSTPSGESGGGWMRPTMWAAMSRP